VSDRPNLQSILSVHSVFFVVEKHSLLLECNNQREKNKNKYNQFLMLKSKNDATDHLHRGMRKCGPTLRQEGETALFLSW
jgi:hypothetical protein